MLGLGKEVRFMAQTSVNFRMDAELKEFVEEITTVPDPFYSESNIRYLEKKMEDYKAGRLKLAEHELIEE